jgi:hypothetical protein
VGILRGRGGAGEQASFFMSTPVWGAGHLGLFLRVGLPSLLAPRNLPGLSCRGTSRYLIYTRPEDEPQLRSSQPFQALTDVMPVEVLLLGGQRGDAHRLMSNCHMDTMRRADAAGAAAVFLPPDCVWSDGSMVRIEAIANSGKSVVHMSGIRLDRDAVVPELSKHLSDGVLSIAPRPLVGIGLRHLHPIALSHFWNEHGGELMPANLIWSVPGEGLLLRCFHLHPLLVKSQVPFANFTSTIDDDLPLHACPDGSGDYVVADSDELVAFELSGRDRVVGTVCAKGSIKGVAAWAEIGTNGRHRELIRQAIRLHSTAMTESVWRAREAESAKVVKAVARVNAMTLRELLRRCPAAARSRIDAAFLAHARKHRWHAAGARLQYVLTRLNAAIYDRLFLRDGAPRMTHPRWLVRRSVLADILRCLPATVRTVALMASESRWAQDIEAVRPGLTVKLWAPAGSPDKSDAFDMIGSGVDALVVVDLDAAGAAVPRGALAALARRGTRCFCLVPGNARPAEDYPCTVRHVGGPGTRLANQVWLLSQSYANAMGTFAMRRIWPIRKMLELAALLLRPLISMCGAMAGLALNLAAMLLDGVHAATMGQRRSDGARGVAVQLPRQK